MVTSVYMLEFIELCTKIYAFYCISVKNNITILKYKLAK